MQSEASEPVRTSTCDPAPAPDPAESGIGRFVGTLGGRLIKVGWKGKVSECAF